MRRKRIILYFSLLFLIPVLVAGGFVAYKQLTSKHKAMMLLIEFEGMDGLNNMANEMDKRDIPGMVMVDSKFINENCEALKKLQDKNIEIVGVYPQKPLWDITYDEQKQIMTDTKSAVERCTGKSMRVFASKYFAYDEDTIRVAEELSIEYVMARGTTKAKATIYKPEEYNVKIFSVSNVQSRSWGTGSLCDYSYWAREGTPEDFEKELFAATEHEKLSPVSHTYIGGLKARWNNVYLKFFDEADLEWLDLDEFGKVDIEEPFAQIPQNREVQYEQPKPSVPLEEEEGVQNVCAE